MNPARLSLSVAFVVTCGLAGLLSKTESAPGLTLKHAPSKWTGGGPDSSTFSILMAPVQVLKGIISKSFSVAVKDCDDRVCGMKVERQRVKPSVFKLTPPSKNLFASTVVIRPPSAPRQARPPHSTAPGPFGGGSLVTALIACATSGFTPEMPAQSSGN